MEVELTRHGGQKERRSTLVRWNSPLVRARYLKNPLNSFRSYRQLWRAKQHLLNWPFRNS
jgi:hypothetical protein